MWSWLKKINWKDKLNIKICTLKTKQRNDDREKIEVNVSKIQTPMCIEHIKLMWKGFSRLGKTSIKAKISNSYVIQRTKLVKL